MAPKLSRSRVRIKAMATRPIGRLIQKIQRQPRLSVMKPPIAGPMISAHPVMPLINDSEESLDGVCAAAARNGASSFSAAPLFLKPCAAQVFLPFLEERFPHLLRRYRERFGKTAYLKGHYPEMIAERVERIRARHQLAARPPLEWPLDDQLELFPSPAKGANSAGPSTVPALQRKVNRL